MQWADMWEILRDRRADYALWLFSQLGGIVVGALASLTIFAFHLKRSDFPPEPQVLLVTGTISVAVTGVNYFTERRNPEDLNPWLYLAWAALVMLVYGVIVVAGVKTPEIPYAWCWVIALILMLACLLWSSIMWLHREGLRSPEDAPKAFDIERVDSREQRAQEALQETAMELSSKMSVNQQTPSAPEESDD